MSQPNGSEDARYYIVRPIARGGMGQIIEVADCDLRRRVAMKALRKELRQNPAWLARFLEEAYITGELEHPSIIPVHELGMSSSGQLYFTMKLVDGVSLQAVIQGLAANDPATLHAYPMSRRLEIFTKICDAMAFAHSRGIIHRDLKPSNVMVGRFGEVLVMDWGLAKRMGDSSDEQLAAALGGQVSLRSEMGGLTLMGEVIGTPGYMAPEQASGALNEIDERTDIFALGAILYALIIGQAPFFGDTADDVIADTLAAKLVKVRQMAPRTPKALAAICEKALSTYKDNRYQTTTSLADDVRRFLAGRSVLARPDPLLVRFWRLLARHRALTAAIIVIIGLLAGGAFYRHHQIEQARLQLTATAELTDFSQDLRSRTVNYLTQAEESLALAQGLISNAVMPLKPPDQLLLLFKQQLEVNPAMFGFSLVQEDGTYWTVSRAPEGDYRLEQGKTGALPTHAYASATSSKFQKDANRTATGARNEFTPWRQAFLKDSANSQPGKVLWSDIFPLDEGSRLGLMAALPLRTDGNAAAASVVVDLELSGLARLLADDLVRGPLAAVIVDEANRLIAFPPVLGDTVIIGDRFTPRLARIVLGDAALTWGTSLDHECAGMLEQHGGSHGFFSRCMDLGEFSTGRELRWTWRIWSYRRL